MVTGHKDKKGDFHPHTNSSGAVSENDMKISVKGNNDVIKVQSKPTSGMKGNRENEKVYVADKITMEDHVVQIRGDLPPHSSKDHLNYGDYGGWELLVDGKVVKKSDNFHDIEKEYEKHIVKLEKKGDDLKPKEMGRIADEESYFGKPRKDQITAVAYFEKDGKLEKLNLIGYDYDEIVKKIMKESEDRKDRPLVRMMKNGKEIKKGYF